jgi:predicted dehydrogenase
LGSGPYFLRDMKTCPMNMEKNMDRYRILVVGCGSIGQRHARLLSERKNIDLFIADSSPECRAACAAVADAKEVFSEFDKALACQPDGVFICTPNYLHVEMAGQALDAGACVLLEKPVADTLAEARRLAAHSANGKVAVGYAGR